MTSKPVDDVEHLKARAEKWAKLAIEVDKESSERIAALEANQGWHQSWHQGQERKRVRTIQEQAERIAALERAIYWALGEEGEFPHRQEGQGAYWWRRELRALSGLPVKARGEGEVSDG